MKKRILALALAGTTAFSMFGGLSVSAASYTTDEYEGYSAVVVNVSGTNTITADGVNVAKDDMVDLFDLTWDDALDTAVVADTVYAYDWYDYAYNSSKALAALEDAITSESPKKDFVALVTGIGDLVEDDGDLAFVLGAGQRGTIRYDVVQAWKTFVGSVSTNPSDYNYTYTINKVTTDLYNFVGTEEDHGLLLDIVDAKTNYLSMPTSELVYLMQQYDYYVEGGLVSLKNVATTEWADLLVDILEARTEDDFSTKRNYVNYALTVEELVAAYEGATTVTAFNKAVAALETAVTSKEYGTSTAADKTALLGEVANLYYGLNTKSIPGAYLEEVTSSVYPLYPEADYLVAGTPTSEYSWFADVYELAMNIYGMSKSYSYQGSIDVITDALAEAAAALDTTTSPMPSKLLALEEAVEARSDYLESDYKTGAWANYTKALEFADSVLAGDPGKTQTTYATAIVKDAAAALDRQVNQNPIKLSQVKALNASITKAEAWLKEYDDTTSAAQILAVTSALADAKIVANYYSKNGDTDKNVISDITGATEALDAALNYADVVLGWSKDAAGEDVYGTPDGYLANGWNKIGNAWYYFNADGTAKRNTWFKDTDGKWYWFTNNCNAAYGWCKVKDNWFFFDGGCAMKTGWVKSAGSWYYLKPEKEDGRMLTGWQEIDGKWYYFSKETNALGQMLANTTVDGYTLGADGAWVK